MIDTVDHLIIAVEDLDKAEANYTKIFGMSPVWRGGHKELGTTNSLFNFQNTYFELLSASGEGLGAALVNHYLEEKGEGLIGIVFGTKDINKVTNSLKEGNFLISDATDGEGTNSKDSEVRKWKNLFLPPEITRGLFSFIIQHTEGTLLPLGAYSNASINPSASLVLITT